MLHSPLSRRPLPFPVKRIEDRHRFSTLAVCHALIRPIALIPPRPRLDEPLRPKLLGPRESYRVSAGVGRAHVPNWLAAVAARRTLAHPLPMQPSRPASGIGRSHSEGRLTELGLTGGLAPEQPQEARQGHRRRCRSWGSDPPGFGRLGLPEQLAGTCSR